MARMVLFMWACLTLVVSMPAQGMTWYVDGSVGESGDGSSPETAFKKIQEGIDAAWHGDTVMVAEGTYVENINFKGMNITLTSSDPLDPDVVAGTIIDGNQAGSVVSFAGTEIEACVLSGFTIRNGKGSDAGGVWGNRTHATIENNVISSNSVGYGGGGMNDCDGSIYGNTISGNSTPNFGGGLRACDGTIRDNVITDNLAGSGGGLDNCQGTIRGNTISGNSARGGGGLYNCGGTIEENTITGNSATAVSGGGLYECNGIIQSNRISGNSAAENGGGLSSCDAIIRDNSISENEAGGDGGGLYNCLATVDGNLVAGNSAGGNGGGLCYCAPVIQNNLITGNSASRGGGLYICDAAVQNNTIAANKAGTAGGLYDCAGAIRNCVIRQNTGGKYPQLDKCNVPSYCCIQGWTGGGQENISGDPKFVDAGAGDYHLQAESPCIDKGVNYYWFAWPQQDLDGNCRLVGEREDMGCYEYGSSLDSDGDLVSDGQEATLQTYVDFEDSDDDGLRDGLEILRGTDPLDGWDPSPVVVRVPMDTAVIQRSLCVAVDGDEIILHPGTYKENLVLCGANVILRSSDPESQDVVGSTIIDGGGRAPVISLTGNETEECVIAGLTIRNGRAGSGGGIGGGTYVQHTHATIRLNTISANSALGSGGAIAYSDGAIQSNVIASNSSDSAGGGLSGCSGTIEGNVISGNWSGHSGGGLMDCDGWIVNNAIIGNSTVKWGGGLRMSDGTVENNTICHNKAGESGGGINEGQWATIRNCIISGNTAPEGPELIYSSAPINSWVGGADPGFVDADGPDNNPSTWQDNDYHLTGSSPCIDKGKNGDWMWSAVDLDGKERIIDGDEDGSDVVDMGAYEYRFVLRVVAVAAAGGGDIQLTWSSRPGQSYVIWRCQDLLAGDWADLAIIPSGGLATTWSDPIPSGPTSFYRIGID